MRPELDVRIRGRLVELCPFEEELITSDYLGWLNNKDLMRYSRQRFVHHTRESSIAYLRNFDNSPNEFWSIHRRSDHLYVGTMTAYVDSVVGVADIGILVGHAEARGKGLGREAWGLTMDYLFRVEGMQKVTGGTSAQNAAMVKVFHHWQMRLEEIKRGDEVIEGRPMDVLRFGMLRSEWEKSYPNALAELVETNR